MQGVHSPRPVYNKASKKKWKIINKQFNKKETPIH